MKKLSIYYAHLAFATAQTEGQATLEAQPDPLLDAVTNWKETEHWNHHWVLGDLQTDTHRNLVFGRMGHPAEEKLDRVAYDATTNKFEEKHFNLPGSKSGAFVLNYKTGAMAFEADQIKPTGFVNHLCAILNNSAPDGKFTGSLDTTEESYRDFLASVTKVTSVTFEVRPTNPRDRKVFEAMDKGMKAANATRMRTTIENKEEGLIIDPPDTRDKESANLAVQGIEMNEEGYGNGFRMDAEKDGVPRRFHSGDRGSLISEYIDGVSADPNDRLELVMAQFVMRETGEVYEVRRLRGPVEASDQLDLLSPDPIAELESPDEPKDDGSDNG